MDTRDRDRGPSRPERRPSRDDGDRPQRSGPDRSARRGSGEPMARLWIGAGRVAGVRPADLVGAISGETGLKSAFIGGIEIADRFSLVEVPEEVADDVIEALAASKLRGQKVTIRRDRDAGAVAGPRPPAGDDRPQRSKPPRRPEA
jgi:ATP-dependent RNA helicase DeaD